MLPPWRHRGQMVVHHAHRCSSRGLVALTFSQTEPSWEPSGKMRKRTVYDEIDGFTKPYKGIANGKCVMVRGRRLLGAVSVVGDFGKAGVEGTLVWRQHWRRGSVTLTCPADRCPKDKVKSVVAETAEGAGKSGGISESRPVSGLTAQMLTSLAICNARFDLFLGVDDVCVQRCNTGRALRVTIPHSTITRLPR